MAAYVDLCNQNLNRFYTPEVYGYDEEFGSKNLFQGTYMPLSAICVSLKINHHMFSGGSENWEDYYGIETSEYELNNLGKLIYHILKQKEHLHGMERTRIGSVGINIYAKNERRRQVSRFNKYYDDYHRYRTHHNDVFRVKALPHAELEVFRKFCLEHVAIDIELFKGYLWEIRQAIQKRIDDNDTEAILASLNHYISEQNKQRTSIMPRLNLSYPYLVKREDPIEIAKQHVAIIDKTILHLYSRMRVNPDIFLNPLRQRPTDFWVVTDRNAKGRMSRSRKPLGVPQFSHIKITIYDLKKEIDKAFVQKMIKQWGFSEDEMFTPFTRENFMHDFFEKKKGIYISGDNGCNISSAGEKRSYDVSMSEAVCAYATRNDKGENFCYYIRLSNKLDTGSSGDPITWAWNINNQLKLWKCFKEGRLRGTHFPEIEEIIDKTNMFLGAFYDVESNTSSNVGLRTTKDSADQMIPYTFKVGDNELEWPMQDRIEDTALMQTIITSGATDITLEDFYAWAKKKKLLTGVTDVEDYSLSKMIERMLLETEDRKDFFQLFDNIDLDYLAYPMTIDYTKR